MGRFSDIIEQSDFPVSPDTSKDPDRFAADKELSKQTGLPVDYVERNRDEAEQIKRQNIDYSQYADTELGGSLTDPEFSNLAQDDLDNLSYLERTFKGLGTTISESVKQGIKGVALSAMEDGAKTATSAMMPGVYDPFVSDIYDERAGGDFTADVKQAASGIAIESIQQNEEAIKAATPEGLDVLQKGIRSGIQSLAQMVPGLAASIATRSSAPMLTMAGVQSYGDSYATARARGLSPEESGRYAMVDAGIEVATEKLPADKLLKITGEFGDQTLKQVVRFLVTEGATEQVATFLQSMNAWHQGLDEELDNAKDAEEIARIQAERQAVTLISTIVAGGAQSGVAAGVGYAANKLDKNQPLKDLKATAEQSNLKRRSPEQFRQFLQAVDPLANIFIPASALEGVTITPDNPTLKLVADQLPQARSLGGDIVLPVADVMTDIPQDVFDAVYPYMRVDADGVAEIEDRPDMKALIEEVNRDADNQKQAKAFREKMHVDMVATGRITPDQAKKYSAVISARIEPLAIDKGMTFDEAVQKYVGDLKVVGPDVTVGDGAIMDQPGSTAFDNWFGDSKVVDENGKPLVMYHGTSEDISVFNDPRNLGGIFFTASPEIAQKNAEKSSKKTGRPPVVYPVYLRLENPSSSGLQRYAENEDGESVGEYDGYISSAGFRDEVAVFSPEQIKSAIGNRGTFDPNDPNILAQSYTPEETAFFESQGVLDGEPVSVESIQAQKDQAKAVVNELLSSGAITAEHSFRGTSMDELRAIAETGELQVGRDAEGVPGISAAVIGDGQFPVYGEGVGIIIPPEAVTESGRAGEVLVDENTDPRSLQYVVDGKVLSFDEMKGARQYAQSRPSSSEKNLFVAHNLSAENLIHADELGGLAAPSIAIGKAGTSEFTGYGEITLLAKPELVESSKARTFDSDAYSPRHPRASYKIDPAKAFAFVNEIKTAAKEAGGLRVPDIDEMGSNGASELQRSEGLQYAWLKQNGKAPKVVKKPHPDHIKAGIKIANNENATSDWQLEENKVFRSFAESYFRDLGKKYEDAGRPNVYVDDGEVDFRFVQRLAKDVIREINNGGVDAAAMTEAIAKKFRNKKLRDEFDGYVTDKFNDLHTGKQIFKGFTNSGNKKYIPYTLENVVNEMTQKLKAGENFNYGVGNIRAAFSHEFKGLEEIKQYRDDIISSGDFAKIKEESQQKLSEALDALRPFYKFDHDSWGYLNDASSAIAEGAKGQAEAFRMTKESREIIGDLISYLKSLPTEYFETKIQRAVSLSEFDTAIVPKDVSKKALDVLKAAGLKIKYYDQNKNGSRQEVINKQEKLFFQTLKESQRGLISITDKEIVIKLTNASNASTFLHEAGHLFLEIESRIARLDGVSESQQKMLGWLGVKAFEEIGVEQHEKFARGFEAYAMEGRAPSADLVEVFRSFARWLKKVYSSMKSLNVELNDDIRQFFDRMLAADQAIKDAERLNQYSALFKDAKTAGMTDAEYADYQAHLARANSRGNETLQSKLLKELTRQTEKWWKESLASERDKATESLGEQPLYRATRFLSGDLKIEGYDNPKLDTEVVKSMLGVEPVVRAKPQQKPKAPVPLVDPRLKRDVYRGHLEAMVNRDLLSVKEGNLALVVDNTPQGESDARGSVKMKRSSSVNPQWFQDFNKASPSPISVDQARAIVKKAVAGERLGVNQARFIIAALDEITGKRGEYADTLKRQRDAVREQRKYMAEMYPVPAEYHDFNDIEKAGEVYRDAEYMPDLDYLDRSMSELAYAAIGVGVPEDTVMGIIDANTTIAAIEQIQKLYKEKTDERAGSLAGTDQATTEEVEGKPAEKEQSQFSKFRGLTRKGGIHPDEVAALFDFASGHELVMQIANQPTLKQAASAAAQAAMIEQHGDILNDGTLQQEADISAHNEERGKLILSELRVLNRKTGADTINRDALKFSAREVIGKSVLKDIHPGKYRTAEVRAAREAATALAKKNYKAAATAKLKQAANFYLYREAMDAKRKEQSWRRYLKSVQDRKYSTKEVNPDYVRQMKMLAAVYDFRKNGSGTELLGVAQWLKAQSDVPDAAYIPQVLDSNLIAALDAADKGEPVTVKHYRDMTMDELQGVYDMVKHLRWVGGQMSENEKAKRVAEYERVSESIQANSKKGKIEQPRQTGGKIQAIKEGVSQYKADYFPLPDFIERLDGFQSFGPAFNLIYDKVIDSSNVELKLRRETSEKAREIFKEFGSNDFAPGKASVTITTEAGEKLTLDRRGRIMMALYHGSQYSRDVMMQGDNLTLNDINSMLSHLTNKELDLVEAVWALNESFWPQVAEVSRKMTGIVPPKREVVPFAVNGRVMPGGYMRLFYMYDTRDSHVAVSSDEGKITRTGDRLAKQTKHGGRMEVVGSGGRKVQFEVSNIFKALDETIHDIAFAETARDSMAALTSKQVSSAIVNYHGKDTYESMLASLSGVIAGNQSSGGWFNNMARHFRTAQTYAMLGYSIRNLVQQPASLPNVWGYVGFMETNAELIRMWAGGHWKQNIDFVQSKSEFMKNRTALVNRDTAEIMGSISGNVMSSALKRHAFDLQTMADGFVGYPAWMAQYKKSLAEFESDPMEVREKKAIKAADEAVARTIGSGLMKDMSPMLQGGGKLSKQIGPEMLKSLTFMGSYMATVGRLIARANANRDFKTVGGVAKYSREMFFYLVAPALMSALLTGSLPDDDDDEGWAEWTAKTVGKYGLSTVFGLRDIVQVASGYGVQNSYGRALEQMWRSVDIAADVAAGEKEADLETSAKMLRASSGYFTIPFAYQAARTMEYIDSQQDGNEGDFNIYKALVVGKERD